jgi:hypothetical protein
MIKETTTGEFIGKFKEDGMSKFQRSRKAAQYRQSMYEGTEAWNTR